MSVELLTAAGARKAYRKGGSESTEPITLSLAGADVQVTVMMDRNEELRVKPKQGTTEGAQKSCRRKGNTAGASAEVHVAEVAEVRCVGTEWDAPDQPPQSDCLTPVVFFDDFAAGTQWNEIVSYGGTGTGASTSVSNPSTGGNPGGYRRGFHSLPVQTSVFAKHVYTGGSYDPRASGAVRHMHYWEDRIIYNPPYAGAEVGGGFRILQAATASQAAAQYTTLTLSGGAVFGFASLTWQSAMLLRVTPATFGATGPNFSATGGTMTFGFDRRNTNVNVSTPITTTHGTDNWTVVICH
jgi:hypothetical protein